MHEATLDFSFTSETIAKAVFGALTPEAGGDVPKTRAIVSTDAQRVIVVVHADDLAGLRAALNSYARWADAAGRAAGVGRE